METDYPVHRYRHQSERIVAPEVILCSERQSAEIIQGMDAVRSDTGPAVASPIERAAERSPDTFFQTPELKGFQIMTSHRLDLRLEIAFIHIGYNISECFSSRIRTHFSRSFGLIMTSALSDWAKAYMYSMKISFSARLSSIFDKAPGLLSQ